MQHHDVVVLLAGGDDVFPHGSGFSIPLGRIPGAAEQAGGLEDLDVVLAGESHGLLVLFLHLEHRGEPDAADEALVALAHNGVEDNGVQRERLAGNRDAVVGKNHGTLDTELVHDVQFGLTVVIGVHGRIHRFRQTIVLESVHPADVGVNIKNLALDLEALLETNQVSGHIQLLSEKLWYYPSQGSVPSLEGRTRNKTPVRSTTQSRWT